MQKLIKTAIVLLLYLLVFILLVDPADVIFRMKVPLFILILLLWVLEKGISKRLQVRHDSIIFVFVYMVIPLISILIALMQDNLDNNKFAFGFIKSVLILILLFVLDDYRIPVEKILIHTSIILPILTILIYISFLVVPDFYNEIVYVFFSEESGSASFAMRNYYGFDLAMFYFKSSPLLVFPLGYCTYHMMNGKAFFKYMLLALLFLFTLFLSGTRANMLSGTLIFVIIIFENLFRRSNKVPLLFASIAVMYFVGLFIFNASFEERDISQQIKSEHVTSYMEIFQENPQYLIWGQGLGSEFFSKGFGFFTPQSELTYFDIIRMFGIPLGILFIALTLYPVIKLFLIYFIKKEAIYALVIFSAYLFIAGTNPLLISSTGILAILAILSTIRQLDGDLHDQTKSLPLQLD